MTIATTQTAEGRIALLAAETYDEFVEVLEDIKANGDVPLATIMAVGASAVAVILAIAISSVAASRERMSPTVRALGFDRPVATR